MRMLRSKGQAVASPQNPDLGKGKRVVIVAKQGKPVDGYPDKENDNRSFDNFQGCGGTEREVILSE